MTGRIVLPSKKRVDIVSVEADFSGQLLPGEVIAVGELFIQVFSGVDPSPAAMLDGTIFIEGKVLRHRIKLGVVGVVYVLVFQATTDTDRVLEIELLQAVLPDYMPAGPIYQQFYFTTPPYQIESLEGILDALTPLDGDFIQIPLDGILDGFLPVEGTLRDILQFYDMLPEGIVDEFEPLEGTIKDILFFYDIPPEGIVDAFVPVSGILKITLIIYSNYKAEGILDTFTPVSGTLV